MSVDQHLSTIIGYRYEIAELKKLFGNVIPEKFRMEKRFNPKTWKIEGVCDGEEYCSEAMEAVLRAIKAATKLKDLGMDIVRTEDEDDKEVIFGIDFAAIKDQGGRCLVGSTILGGSEISVLFDQVKPVGHCLHRLGFPEYEPVLAVIAYLT